MKKRTLPACLALLAGAASAQQYSPPPNYPPPPPAIAHATANSYPKFTVPVVSATPAYKTEMFERRVCNQAAPSETKSTVGTVLGGIAGGVLGNQVGNGRGRTAATVIGAVGGAVAGNAIGNNMQTAPECQLVSEPQQVMVGYDVIYDFSGQKGHVRMPVKPGPNIVVEVRPEGL